jgi:hypothetical protein
VLPVARKAHLIHSCSDANDSSSHIALQSCRRQAEPICCSAHIRPSNH